MFLDLIEWYSQDRSTAMRYKVPESVEFWRIGYKLFKGKFLRFMGGPKSSGHVNDDSKSLNFYQKMPKLTLSFIKMINIKHVQIQSGWGIRTPLIFQEKGFLQWKICRLPRSGAGPTLV